MSVISNHCQGNCLFNRLFLFHHWRNHEWPCYWHLLKGIHRWPVDSSKGPIMWKTCSRHDVIITTSTALPYSGVIMSAILSQIASLAIVCPTVYSGADQRKHQRSASLAFVRGIHRWAVNSPHKRPVMQNMFPFDNVIMVYWSRTRP